MQENRDTSIEYIQDLYFHYDAKRATGALATGRKALKAARHKEKAKAKSGTNAKVYIYFGCDKIVDEFLTPVHLEIVHALRQSGVAVLVENHKICKTQKFDGHFLTKIDKQNPVGKPILLVCIETIKRNYEDWQGELNRTIAHEAVHAAQACKWNDGYIRELGFRKDIEKEAFAIQDKPREVLRVIRKYCL